jgi:hypothetical protein
MALLAALIHGTQLCFGQPQYFTMAKVIEGSTWHLAFDFIP